MQDAGPVPAEAPPVDLQPSAVAAVLDSEDLLSRIFRFLDVLDLCRVSPTSKAWSEVALSGEFWTKLVLTRPMQLRQVRQGAGVGGMRSVPLSD